MSDEKLLRDLARLAQEEEHLDERWDRLASGTLTAEEEVALASLAESSDEAREAYEAFRPLGADFRARLVNRLAAEMPATEARAPRRPAKRSRLAGMFLDLLRPPTGFLALATALLAAGLALWLLPRPGERLPPLPEYSLGLEGEVRELRGETPAGETVPAFAPGHRFELLLRPGSPVSGPVAARIFLQRRAEVQVLEAEAEVSASGSVRWAGTLGREIRIEPGEWTLWALVGRPGELPGPEELRAHLAESEAAAGYVRRSVRLRVLSAAEAEDLR